jgi:hypothetical protein
MFTENFSYTQLDLLKPSYYFDNVFLKHGISRCLVARDYEYRCQANG